MIHRSYLLIALAIIAGSSPAAAQTAALPEQPLLGSTLAADLLKDLPTSNNPFAILETIQPETIGNGFTSAGLNVATAPEFGAFLNSWNQTQFRIGDVTITDPRAGGLPLLLPTVAFWDRITTMTGPMGGDENASALSMSLQPPRPAAAWVRTLEGFLSGSGLASAATGPVPAVDRVRHWQDGTFLVSGPVNSRLGLAAAGSWRGLLHVTAPNTSATNDQVASGLAHLVLAATPRDEIRVLGWAQGVTTRAFSDTAMHLQSTWERREPMRPAWRVFGGYTERTRTAPAAPTLVVDSFTSDPVSDLLDHGVGSARRWVLGARATSPGTRHAPSFGIDIEGARMSAEPAGIEQIRERVDGSPARVWTIQSSGGTDARHSTTLSAYGSDRITLRRLTIDAGLRLEATTATADAAASAIRWTTWLPRGLARWHATDIADVSFVAGYRRAAYQLPLNVLAIGDPAAPVADVSRWNGVSVGPLIARVGPGTGGDAAFTRIDSELQRPITDEVVLAIESRPMRGLQLQLARVTKWERSLLGFVDTGLPSSAYTTLEVPDPDFLAFHTFGAPQLTVYSRPPAGYGRDRYLLTNQIGDPARFWGLELTIRASTERFTVLFGGNLTEAEGPAAASGFLPTENDQDVLGNLFVDPNATTRARGQLFPDRSHVLKLAAVYRFPGRVRLGAVARYQDGQPFARLVVVPGLTQGPTAVRAYANGGSAFTYTGTLDVRLQKTFIVGRTEVAAIVDVYNLPNLDNEVSEYVGSGSMFRTPTTLQPPRTALVGVRVTF